MKKQSITVLWIKPLDEKGLLVTMHWDYGITEYILAVSGMHSTIVMIDNIELGIRAEYIEVIVSRKIADQAKGKK